MSSTAVASLSPAEVQQLSLSYAAFILSDAGAKVNAQTLQAVLDAAGLKTEKLWVDLFSKALTKTPVESFFSLGGGAAGAAPAAAEAPAKEEKKDAKKDDKKGKEKSAPAPAPVED
jgi:ribosomal protein L12E/L44/L45/RPP1/RPP2